MATSKVLSTSNSYVKYQITVTEGTADVAGNLSPVTVSVKFYRTNTGHTTYGTGTVYCKINGTTYSAAVTPSQKITNSGIVLFTKTLNISHDDDGGKTLPVTAWISLNTPLTSNEQGFDVELTTIARASQPSCITWPEHTQNVGNFGDTISIHMNRKSSDFEHAVYYSFGSVSWAWIASGVTTGLTWTIPTSLMDQLPSTTKGSGTIHVETYHNGKHIGTKSCGFTANVPASVKPTCSIQVLDATDIKDTYGNLVKGHSKLRVKTTGGPAYSSPIAAYAVTANGVNYTDADITTGPLTAAGTTTITATVTDKRGRKSAVAEASFDVLDYNQPFISALSVHRCDASGAEDDQGEYVQVIFSAAITPLNNKNSAAYRLKYKKSDDDNYTTVNFSALAGKYAVTDHEYIFAADSDYSYDVTVEAEDDFGPVPLSTSASTAFTFMDWNDDGKSIAFGKVSEESGTLENALNLKQFGNQYCYGTQAGNVMGYVAMAQIEITSTYANAPIKFEFSHRSSPSDMTVHVRFYNENNLDPSLNTVVYEGDNYGAFLVNSAPSIWKLYIGKRYANDGITLQRWTAPVFMNGRVKVTFPGDVVDEVPQGLRGYYRATPAKLQSVLDFIYPVGSIYLSYSHVSPATLFGGTWERLENTFLWAVDEKGTIGQTGGEKEHTLTQAEMPAHDHGSYYNNYASTLNYGWQTNTGDKLGYSKVTIGGGQPHNNMPPFTQISAWRRTA